MSWRWFIEPVKPFWPFGALMVFISVSIMLISFQFWIGEGYWGVGIAAAISALLGKFTARMAKEHND